MSKSKHVEWRDTQLDYCVDYGYSLFVRNRCVFFYSEAKRWIKTLNFAANFMKPSNICIVFLYGEGKWREETFRKRLGEIKGNLIILHFDTIQNAWLSELADYKAWERKKRSNGYLQDGKLAKSYYAQREQIESAVHSGILPETDGLYLEFQKDRAVVESHDRTLELIRQAQFGDARCYSTFLPESTMQASNEALTEAIIQRFPYGVEADTRDVNCVKIAKVNSYIRSGLQHTPEMQIRIMGDEVQLSLFDDSTRGATAMIDRLRSYCADAIESKGRFYLAEAWSVIEGEPFGAYECNWYMYLFAYALSDYFAEGYHVLSGYIPSPSERVEAREWIRHKYGCIFKLTDTQRRLAKVIKELFEGRDTDYVSDALSDAREWCHEYAQTPLAFVDERFGDLLDFNPDRWTKKGEAEKFLPWLESNFDVLYAKIRSVNEDYNKFLAAEEYDPNRIRLFRKYSYVKGGAVGWLHSNQMMKESVERYMKHEHVCRECGRPIEKHTAYVLSNESTSTRLRHDELEFTVKETIGLNKKLLGRYQTEYFCIPCLCEAIDTNEERLYEKMTAFREQGCELF